MRVGKYIAENAGYKRLVLELGGNDPLIVMEDADLDKAAELAVAGATKNSGQRCTAVKRIIVVESIADEFAERVLAKAKKLKAGDPMDPATDVGTVIHERAAKLFQRRVSDAVAKGAKLLHGNDRRARCFRRPWSTAWPCVRAGARGDLRPGHPNDPRQGHRRRDQVSNGPPTACRRALHQPPRLHHPLRQRAAGRHGQHLGSAGLSIEMSPFGGIKDSGLGYKEGVLEAMKSFTNVKTCSLPWPA